MNKLPYCVCNVTVLGASNGRDRAKGAQRLSDIKDKVKDSIDDAADATKKAVDKVVEKSKDAAHKAGEQLERGGKRLQDA
jgi:gas vesicle protein